MNLVEEDLYVCPLDAGHFYGYILCDLVGARNFSPLPASDLAS